MHIFIDESGTFKPVEEGHGPSISLVGALIVPDCQRDELFRRYAKLRPGLVLNKGEVKGRLQDERCVANVVDLLVKNGALYEVTAIDMGDHTEAELEDHKQRQAEKLTANLSDQHHPELVQEVWQLRGRLEQLPVQLYVQSVAMFYVVERSVRHGTLYFSQRIPPELGAFHWVIDAKDRTRTTNWEDWWSKIVAPAIQTISIKQPMQILKGCDYSYFERFDAEVSDREAEKQGLRYRRGTNIGQVMRESFRFSSNPEPGLEMIDVVANATRRALLGRLSPDGWRNIPRLMIHRREQYIHIVNLHDRVMPRGNRPDRPVMRAFHGHGRRMIAPRFGRTALVPEGHMREAPL
jgi:hypothetical protein